MTGAPFPFPQPLTADRIDLWTMAVGEDVPPCLAAELSVLSQEELARAERFRRPEDRALFLTGRLVVRLLAGRYAAVDPRSLEIAPGRGGKPAIVAPAHAAEVAFNLSHTSGLLAWVFGHNRRVGVDVEQVSRVERAAGALDRYFSASEQTALAAVDPAERSRRLTDHWTLKEAFVKATGDGLQHDVSRVAFDTGADPVRCIGGAGPHWFFALLHPTARHSLGLCWYAEPAERISIKTTEIGRLAAEV